MRWRYSRRAGPALKGEFRRAPAWLSRLSVQRPVLQFGFRSGYLSICLRCLLSWVLSKQVEITCVLFFPFVCCFGLLWRLVMRSQFWPFTDVLREIWLAVTRKVRMTADFRDVPDWNCRGSRAGCDCWICRRHAWHYCIYFTTTGCLASSRSFSKRESPRRGSHHGNSFSPP